MLVRRPSKSTIIQGVRCAKSETAEFTSLFPARNASRRDSHSSPFALFCRLMLAEHHEDIVIGETVDLRPVLHQRRAGQGNQPGYAGLYLGSVEKLITQA